MLEQTSTVSGILVIDEGRVQAIHRFTNAWKNYFREHDDEEFFKTGGWG